MFVILPDDCIQCQVDFFALHQTSQRINAARRSFLPPIHKKREQSWSFMNHMTMAFSLASLSASSSKLVLCKKKNVKEEKFTLVPRMKFFFFLTTTRQRLLMALLVFRSTRDSWISINFSYLLHFYGFFSYESSNWPSHQPPSSTSCVWTQKKGPNVRPMVFWKVIKLFFSYLEAAIALSPSTTPPVYVGVP